MKKRLAKFEYGKDCIGSWEVVCSECPFLVHTKALKLKPKICIGGMSTNAQGALVLVTCEHYIKDSFHKERTKSYVNCSHN